PSLPAAIPSSVPAPLDRGWFISPGAGAACKRDVSHSLPVTHMNRVPVHMREDMIIIKMQ
ncbi:MAG: hypothetical protein K2I16_08465, partial [Muribaculaceae bacterium]|nr:hypothetical protein [Muribaculaceae bacterium]